MVSWALSPKEGEDMAKKAFPAQDQRGRPVDYLYGHSYRAYLQLRQSLAQGKNSFHIALKKFQEEVMIPGKDLAFCTVFISVPYIYMFTKTEGKSIYLIKMEKEEISFLVLQSI